ncbi:Steroidogenic acute regulatory protein, mitochondrial [Liparis tanakae]|uniref:START domain-containing protein 1 n=1 Tax=Liparis tanakae TaxID=230148 RepID=A0A4Z2J0J4_9TELE|nr:Steroidogenic acute regulatory protein, mitochondrial [Liparis tanakae]
MAVRGSRKRATMMKVVYTCLASGVILAEAAAILARGKRGSEKKKKGLNGRPVCMVFEILCQILQTDSLSTVQQWLLLAGQREKDLVMGMIKQAVDGADVSGHQQQNFQLLQAFHPGASPSVYGPPPWRKPPRTSVSKEMQPSSTNNPGHPFAPRDKRQLFAAALSATLLQGSIEKRRRRSAFCQIFPRCDGCSSTHTYLADQLHFTYEEREVELLQRERSEGDVICSKVIPGTGKVFRLEAVLDASVDELYDILFVRVLKHVGAETIVTHEISAETAGNLIGQRDFLCVRHSCKQKSRVYLGGTAIQLAALPPQPGFVRAEDGPTCIIIQALDEDMGKSHFTWLLNMDVKPHDIVLTSFSGLAAKVHCQSGFTPSTAGLHQTPPQTSHSDRHPGLMEPLMQQHPVITQRTGPGDGSTVTDRLLGTRRPFQRKWIRRLEETLGSRAGRRQSQQPFASMEDASWFIGINVTECHSNLKIS